MRTSIQLVFYLILGSCLVVRSSVNREEDAEVNLFVNSEKYDVETTVMLNEVARRDKEVAYKVKATLEVAPVWKGSDSEFLLKFELVSPQLLSRGKHVNADFLPHKSIWDSYPQSIFYAHWKNGLIVNSYLDLNELPDIVNYKRSLISLFQLQILDGEGTEIDVSGNCSVVYETLSKNIIRKIKSGCEGEGGWVETRRVTRYTLGAGRRVREVHAEEVHELRAAGGGLKARAWHRLTHAASAPAALPGLPGLPDLPGLLAGLPAWLAPAALYEPPEFPQHWPGDELLDVEAALEAGEALWAASEPGAGGAAAARAALRVLPALCAAPQARLAALLHALPDTARLGALVSALGACGATHTHAAVAALLQLHGDAEPAAAPLTALAADYLAALALAPHPDAGVVEDVLRLGAWPGRAALAGGALAEGALACAASCARRLRAPAASAVRERLLDALDACQEERCRVAHLRALGSLGCAGAADALLRWAEAGAAGESLAALDALAALPPDALRQPARLRRLHALAASGRPLTVRAAALDLLLRLSADAPFGLLPLVHALLDQDDNELVRVLWQRLQALADSHADVAQLLGALPAALRARALLAPGTSSVLVRGVGGVGGEGGAGEVWRADLDSVQVARGGALRRGVVRLVTRGSHATDDTLTVEVQTSGLESFAGAGEADGDDREPLSAALVLSVGGVRLPPVTLFSGQAELLAHVWAGTGSAPTPVLRALRPLPPAAGALRLLDGAVLLLRREAVAHVALDAHAQVSLWSRSARAALEARGGVAVRAALAVRAAWGALHAGAELQLEPRLRIAADLDFYDGVSLCVRVRAADHAPAWRLALNSTLGSGARGVRRARGRAWRVPGRTLALGAQNDAACRTLASAED